MRGRMLQPTTISSEGDPTTHPKAPSTETSSVAPPLPPSNDDDDAPPPAPQTNQDQVAAPPLPPPSAAQAPTTTTTDHHQLANKHFVAKRYHDASVHYKAALEATTDNVALESTLHSNLAATFLRLHRYQEATVSARWAVNHTPTPKAYYRLMQGLEGQRLLPEAIAVGIHALDVLETFDADSSNEERMEGDDKEDEKEEEEEDAGQSVVAMVAASSSRTTILSLLERLHAQTVLKTHTASDAALSKRRVQLGGGGGGGSEGVDEEIQEAEDARRTAARAEEMSRRILGLGPYATAGDKENNNVGAASMESRVNVVDRNSMEKSARIAFPDAFTPVCHKEEKRRMKGYKLEYTVIDGGRPCVRVTQDVLQGEVLYTDMSPVVVRKQTLSFDAVGLDRAACVVFKKMFSPSSGESSDASISTSTTSSAASNSMTLFSVRIRRLFALFNDPNDATVDNPFDEKNRQIFRPFSQEIACSAVGSDRMACMKHYAEEASGRQQTNPLSVILRVVRCILRALQPFQCSDGTFGLSLSLGCPVACAESGKMATVGFKTEEKVVEAEGEVEEEEVRRSIDVVRYVATRDLKAGELVCAVFVGQLG